MGQLEPTANAPDLHVEAVTLLRRVGLLTLFEAEPATIRGATDQLVAALDAWLYAREGRTPSSR